VESYSYTAIQGTDIHGFSGLIDYLKDGEMFPVEMLRQMNESFDSMMKKIGDKNET